MINSSMLSHQLPPLAVPVVSEPATPSQAAASGCATPPVASAAVRAVGAMHDPAHSSTAVVNMTKETSASSEPVSVLTVVAQAAEGYVVI
jgi:hypothetical protein